MNKAKASAGNGPSKGVKVPLMTHLSECEREQIKAIASKEACSMSSIARRLIIEGMERRASQPE